MEVCRENTMSELISISTKQAVKYLNYHGPVFQYAPLRIDPHHEGYPALKAMFAAYHQAGGFEK